MVNRYCDEMVIGPNNGSRNYVCFNGTCESEDDDDDVLMIGDLVDRHNYNEARNNGDADLEEDTTAPPLASLRRRRSGNNNTALFNALTTVVGDDAWNTAIAQQQQRWKARQREASLSATKFEDVYQLTNQVLGRGAYATVVTCVNIVTGTEYAAKVIEKGPGHSRLRIIKEIELFHLCAGHPNIVQLVEYFEEDDKFYLIFEKMSGGSLLQRIRRQICFKEDEAREIVRGISNGLKFLHDRGIAHRDLKPENILCAYTDSVCPIKLCDLDLASKIMMRHQHLNSITTPELQSPVGSAEFMAPEVVDAFIGESLSYDKRCDLWSLGVILYIMLCGYPPFYGECSRSECGWNKGLACTDCQETLFNRIQSGRFDFPNEDWHDKSDESKDLIKHLLTKNVNRRYTVNELLHHPFLNSHPQSCSKNFDLKFSSKSNVNDETCRSSFQNCQSVVVTSAVSERALSHPVWITTIPSGVRQN